MFETGAMASSPVVGLAEVERRVALTRGSGRVDVQEQLDWASVLLASGDQASARLLVEGAMIQQGFSPQLERSRTDLLRAVGLALPVAAVAVAGRPRGNTVDLALAELRAFAQAFGKQIETGALNSVQQVAGKPGLHPTATMARGASLPSSRGVVDLVHDACSWLRPGASEIDDGVGVTAIGALLGSERDPLRWSAAGLAGAALPVLAHAIAVQELRAFLRAQSDLLLPRLGSPALFRATAAFDSAGLGPFFGNVGQIARKSVNLFELADIAVEASGSARDSIVVEAWVALLSRRLSGWLGSDIVDELGDRNASLALTIILERSVAVAADDVDRPLIARIRDAALDNLDYDLAASAQQHLVNLSGNDWLERRILGAIQASAGRLKAADQLLTACLEEHPGDEDLASEVVANRERRYAPIALVKGYGSPRDRQLTRLRRRATAS